MYEPKDTEKIEVVRGKRPYTSLGRDDGSTPEVIPQECERQIRVPSGKGDDEFTSVRITTNPHPNRHFVKNDPATMIANQIIKAFKPEDLEYAQRQSVMVATPCYGGQAHTKFMQSLFLTKAVFEHLKIPFHETFISSESLIPRGRNGMTAAFFMSKYSHMLFIDADIGFEPVTVFRLLIARKDLISAVYPLKMHDWSSVYAYVKQHDPKRDGPFNPEHMFLQTSRYVCNFESNQVVMDQNMYVKIREAPTGFMMMSKALVHGMVQKYGKDSYYANDVSAYDNPLSTGWFFDLFQCPIDETTRRYLSEDYGFSVLAKEAGFEVWADPTAKLTHSGVYTFVGQLAANLAYKHTDPKVKKDMLNRLGIPYNI